MIRENYKGIHYAYEESSIYFKAEPEDKAQGVQIAFPKFYYLRDIV